MKDHYCPVCPVNHHGVLQASFRTHALLMQHVRKEASGKWSENQDRHLELIHLLNNADADRKAKAIATRKPGMVACHLCEWIGPKSGLNRHIGKMHPSA